MEWTGMELGNNDFSSEGPSLGRLFASRYPPETDFVSMLHRWIFVRRKKMNIMKIGGGGLSSASNSYTCVGFTA
jgi:hypothetical protein